MMKIVMILYVFEGLKGKHCLGSGSGSNVRTFVFSFLKSEQDSSSEKLLFLML